MTARAPTTERDAFELSVTGVVQGVGFRPFVHRLALRHGLDGWVRNEAGEVRIAIEGGRAATRRFIDELRSEAPPLARIDGLDVRPATPLHSGRFEIIESTDQPDRRQPVSPDVAMCPACEAEILDPANRRHRYAFTTCTDCGPRYTVIEAMPYDRERTSMRAFAQCPDCLREYGSPEDRRYHSESNSCPACGPRLWLETAGDGAVLSSDVAAIRHAADALRRGRIVAIRGLGGFHLAVDATDQDAVQRLRERKCREAKPLAVMVASLDEARRVGHVSEPDAALLRSRERPIVLLPLRPDAGIAPAVAPGLDTIGVMTPYTPLHRLLLDEVGRPLIMTSGNRSEEPIATTNADARERLGEIADDLLLHDREIVARYDDSVVRVVAERPVFLRRARGYAPLSLDLPVATPRPLVAVGPHLKNTFTLAHEHTAYVSQHIGDLENLETLEHFRQSLDAFGRLFRIEPSVAVRDLHPGYLSTRIAEELGLETTLAVQHHHAHIAAVAAEHGVTGTVIGVAYDGTGYGADGAVWGAEIMVADLSEYRRLGQLRYVPLPGGDLAARQPWRVALGYASLEPAAARMFEPALAGIDPAERRLAERQLERRLNAPDASSMGRLFDAAAAILGTRYVSHYEGQAAMELEALAANRPAPPLPFPITTGDGEWWELDPIPLLVALAERRARGDDPGTLAASFHESVAATTASLVARVAEATGHHQVALGGGVFQNARLLSGIRRRLLDAGFTVLVPARLSPNDGSISYGQAAVAATRLQEAHFR